MVAQAEGNTKGCTYYAVHNQVRHNDSQTHVLYPNTFQVGPGEGKGKGLIQANLKGCSVLLANVVSVILCSA